MSLLTFFKKPSKQPVITKEQAKLIAQAEIKRLNWSCNQIESMAVSSSLNNWHIYSMTRCMGWDVYIDKTNGEIVKAAQWGGRVKN